MLNLKNPVDNRYNSHPSRLKRNFDYYVLSKNILLLLDTSFELDQTDLLIHINQPYSYIYILPNYILYHLLPNLKPVNKYSLLHHTFFPLHTNDLNISQSVSVHQWSHLFHTKFELVLNKRHKACLYANHLILFPTTYTNEQIVHHSTYLALLYYSIVNKHYQDLFQLKFLLDSQNDCEYYSYKQNIKVLRSKL